MNRSSSWCAGSERQVCNSINSRRRRYWLYESGALPPYSFVIKALTSEEWRPPIKTRSSTRHSSLVTVLKCRARDFVRFVGARVDNLAHLGGDALDLFVLRVEVWRDAKASAGAVVNDY